MTDRRLDLQKGSRSIPHLLRSKRCSGATSGLMQSQKTRPLSRAASGRQPGFYWHVANSVETRTKITPTSFHINKCPIKNGHSRIPNEPPTWKGANTENSILTCAAKATGCASSCLWRGRPTQTSAYQEPGTTSGRRRVRTATAPRLLL